MTGQIENQRPASLVPYLIFLCTIPFGELSILSGLPWLTVTKLGFLLLLACLGLELIRGWKPPYSFRLYAVSLAFLCGAFLATMFSPNRGASFTSFTRLTALTLMGIVTFWLVKEKRERLSSIFTVLLAIGTMLSLLGIYQSLTGRTLGTLGFYGSFGRLIEIFQPTGTSGVSVFRASATFDHPNIFGTFLIAIIPFALLAAPPQAAGRPTAVLRFVSVLLCAVAVILTFSRSAWLGLASAVAVLFLLRAGRARALLILCAGVLLAIALLPQNARTILWNRSSTTQSYDAGRIYSYRTAAKMIGSHPLLGIGPGMFDSAYKTYGSPDEVYRQNKQHRMDAHNMFLDLWAEAGLLTLLPFLFLLAIAWTSLERFATGKTGTDGPPVIEHNCAVALLAALVAVSVQSLFQSIEYEEILWILIGAAMSFGNSVHNTANEKRQI